MTPEELTLLAVEAALAYGREHSYVSPGFKPHEWVIKAMIEAYNLGHEDGYERGIREYD